MPNTNFQTFHQMGMAINEVVRQASGRDPVQNIVMDHVTVAQKTLGDVIGICGNPINFHANYPASFSRLLLVMNPIQDLHGFSHPWIAGAGQNMVNIDDFSASSSNVTVTITGESVHITSNGASTYLNARIQMAKHAYSAGTYYVKFKVRSGAVTNDFTKLAFRTSGGAVRGNIPINSTNTEYEGVITIQESCYLAVMLNGSSTGSSQATDLEIYDLIVSDHDIPYEPYVNICPITGRTEADVTINGTTIPVTFPEIVYGGSVDIISGVLTVNTYKWTPNFNTPWFIDGDDVFTTALPYPKQRGYDKAICSHFIVETNNENARLTLKDTGFFTLEDFKQYAQDQQTAGTPIQIAYILGTPLTYQLTPQEISALVGDNTIYSTNVDYIDIILIRQE